MLQVSFPSACKFLDIDETPLVTCFCIKKNHVCQILYKLKEEYGDIFVGESDDNGRPGNAKANENDPVAWQVDAWTLDPLMCFVNTSCSSFLALKQ